MPLKLRDRSKTPPGGWRYRQPESGMVIAGSSWDGLLTKVKEHRVANKYPITIEMERQVEAYLCQQAPEVCVEEGAPTPRTFRIHEVLSFTSLMLESIFTGSPRSDTQEANRRAEICAGCVDNVKPEGCKSCSENAIQQLVGRVTGARPTRVDDRLQSCRHCGCLNRAQVWFPLEMLQRHTSKEVNDLLPSHCWKKLKD